MAVKTLTEVGHVLDRLLTDCSRHVYMSTLLDVYSHSNLTSESGRV